MIIVVVMVFNNHHNGLFVILFFFVIIVHVCAHGVEPGVEIRVVIDDRGFVEVTGGDVSGANEAEHGLDS